MQGFEAAIPVLRAIVRGKLPDVSNADRIRAADVLGRYGGMSYSEAEARAEVYPPVAVMPTFRAPSNGRELVARDAFVIPG